MSKTPEEKAREYAKQEAFNNSYDDESYRHIYDIVERAYISGYHSRDEEVKELREALKEMVNAIDFTWFDMAWEGRDVSGLKDAAAKAKQLLKEE